VISLGMKGAHYTAVSPAEKGKVWAEGLRIANFRKAPLLPRA
jgi:hypothetical protein